VERFSRFSSVPGANPKFRPFGSRDGSETAKERLEERPILGQGHGQRFSYICLPIMGSFIAIKGGGGENDQLAC
jgi:hypothetical protein